MRTQLASACMSSRPQHKQGALRRWPEKGGGCGLKGIDQDLGDVSSSSRCSSEVLEGEEAVPRRVLEGRVLQAESIVHAEEQK